MSPAMRQWTMAGGLLAAALVVLMIGLWMASPGDRAEREHRGEKFLPGLREVINEVERIQVIGPGEETLATLERDDERWRVVQRDGHEADFARVRDLLRDLADAEIVDARTAREDWYRRLGVTDIADSDAEGLVLRFPDQSLPGVIVGRAAEEQGGHFVRRESEARSWLVDRRLRVEDNPVDWLERSVMDIPAEEMERVTVRHPDGQVVRVHASGMPDTPFILMQIPEGQELRDAWRINEIADGLAGIRLEDVRPHDQVPSDAVRSLYSTMDGLNFIVSAFEDDEGYWVHFRVSAETPASGSDQIPSPEVSEQVAGAAAVDARLSPWQYQIRESDFQRLTRRLEDLVAPRDED